MSKNDACGITDLFFNEVEKCRNAMKETDSINTPEEFYSHIRSLFDSHNLGKQFDQALAELMAYQGLKLY